MSWNQTEANSSSAYWIAFGPWGPRTEPPQGEGKKVFLYTVIGLGVSAAVFGAMRAFAKPAPATMTKEWQEATNEYLKVRTISNWLGTRMDRYADIQLLLPGSKLRPLDRYLVRGLQGQGPHPVPLIKGLNQQVRFLLSLDAILLLTGQICLDITILKKSLGRRTLRRGAEHWRLLVLKTGWGCKYCTMLTMRHRFLFHGGFPVVVCFHISYPENC